MAQRKRKGEVPNTASSNTMFYAVLGVIALGGVIAIGYALMGAGGGTAATEIVELDAPNAQALYDQAAPIRLGAADAPVKLIEFGDFQCPGCGQFSLQVRPFIVDRYVKTGQVQFTYYDFPLISIHDHAVLAARASRCAGEQSLETPASLVGVPGEVNAAYWAYHDKLYEEQGDWAYQQGSVTRDFIGYAGEVGLDEDEFGQCLNSDRFVDVVSANHQLAEQLRLSGTPTIIVNNRRLDDFGTQSLAEAIELALGQAVIAPEQPAPSTVPEQEGE